MGNNNKSEKKGYMSCNNDNANTSKLHKKIVMAVQLEMMADRKLKNIQNDFERNYKKFQKMSSDNLEDYLRTGINVITLSKVIRNVMAKIDEKTLNYYNQIDNSVTNSIIFYY